MAVIRILLDTNAYAAFKRGNVDAVEMLRHADQIGISVIMIGELLAGFAAGSHTSNPTAIREQARSYTRIGRVELFASKLAPTPHRKTNEWYNRTACFMIGRFLTRAMPLTSNP